ncbi:MAG: site-2 protease family protein [Planctomycetota bacterium]
MTGNFYWSASAGRWMGVPVRLHVLLFLFIAMIFGVEAMADKGFTGTAFVTTLILIFSIIVHELAHVFAISNLGGHVNSVVLAPWGGSSDLVLPSSNRDKAMVLMAGPFANLIIALLCCFAIIQSGQSSFTSLINPFDPHLFHADAWEISVLKITAWLNFQLFAVNLIPGFPFDFAGVLRAFIAYLNPQLPRLRTETTIMVIGRAVSFTLIGLGWVLGEYGNENIGPPWLLAVLFGITLFFSTRFSFYAETAHTEDEWDELDQLELEAMYEESSFYEFPEDETDGHSQWLSEKQEARKREEERREADEDRRADEILERVHREGMSSITEEEKRLLQRVSARIRARRDEVSG